MSAGNGVIRIDRKGIKKFAIGDGEPFDVDVVVAQQEWVSIDDSFRPPEFNEDGTAREIRSVPSERVPDYYKAAKDFVTKLMGNNINEKGEINQPPTIAEALEFLARLREQWQDLVVFFQPKSREERGFQDTSESQSMEVVYSEEKEN